MLDLYLYIVRLLGEGSHVSLHEVIALGSLRGLYGKLCSIRWSILEVRGLRYNQGGHASIHDGMGHHQSCLELCCCSYGGDSLDRLVLSVGCEESDSVYFDCAYELRSIRASSGNGL